MSSYWRQIWSAKHTIQHAEMDISTSHKFIIGNNWKKKYMNKLNWLQQRVTWTKGGGVEKWFFTRVLGRQQHILWFFSSNIFIYFFKKFIITRKLMVFTFTSFVQFCHNIGGAVDRILVGVMVVHCGNLTLFRQLSSFTGGKWTS